MPIGYKAHEDMKQNMLAIYVMYLFLFQIPYTQTPRE